MSHTTKSVTLYHMDGCHHCSVMMPEWLKFKNTYLQYKNEFDTKFGYELNIKDYEYNQNPTIAKDISGFPTIKYGSGGSEREYKGSRDAKSFFEAVTGKQNDALIEKFLKHPPMQSGGDYIVLLKYANIDMPQIKYKNSYNKYLKYKKKCEKYHLV